MFPNITDETMPRRVLHAAALWLAALAVFSAAPLHAQQITTLAVSGRSLQVDDLLRRGRELERDRRWGEALAHYEDALRLFPGEDSLQRRIEAARLHYDLSRRYADRSFANSLVQLAPDRAMDLYDRVLVKIQTHYVESPNWQDLVQRRADDLDVALGESVFREQNIPQQDWAGVEAFRRELRQTLAGRAIASRQQACEAVAAAAALAQRRVEIRPTAAILEFICGATNSLDPYSSYLTADQLSEVYSQIEGNFVGLGIELKSHAAELVIVRVISGSPAEQAGLLAGDRILSVNGVSTKDVPTEQAANMLQGEEGTTVALTVAAPGQSPRAIAVRRRRVEVPSVDKAQMLDAGQGIASLRITCFQKTTRRDLEAALWQLHRQGMKSLVIDLRGNPGGLLVAAVEAVELFVDSGVIVSTRGRSAQEDFTYTSHGQARGASPWWS